MVGEAKVRTATRVYSDGTHISISEAVVDGDTLAEKVIMGDAAGKIAEGHAKGHAIGHAIEEIAKYGMLSDGERRRMLEGYSSDP